MKTPTSTQLDNAADWCEACQGEDREGNATVAAWLRFKALEWDRRRVARIRKAAPRTLGRLREMGLVPPSNRRDAQD